AEPDRPGKEDRPGAPGEREGAAPLLPPQQQRERGARDHVAHHGHRVAVERGERALGDRQLPAPDQCRGKRRGDTAREPGVRGHVPGHRPRIFWMIDFAMKPSIPNASTKNSTKVPRRPAFDSRASCQMMNSMNRMNAPIPKVTPNS